MGIYNFKEQFVGPVLAGEKTHTIRAKRKHPDKPGDLLFLYTGLRHRGARRLLVAPCLRVEEIRISPSRAGYATVVIDDQILCDDEKEQLARRDGFRDFAVMMEFWQGRLPFIGDIIHWDFATSTKPPWMRPPEKAQ